MYATGSASTPAALLAAIEAFATSAGWTIDRTTSVYNPGGGGGSSTDYWLAMHQGACYLNYWYQTASLGVLLYPADGYNAANAPNAQCSIGNPGGGPPFMNIGAGPYTGYHLFSTTAGPIYLHCVIEISGGIFGQLHGGILNAAGGAAPAIYGASTAWNYTGLITSFCDALTNIIPFGLAQNNFPCVLVSTDGVLDWKIATSGGSVGHRLIVPARGGGFQNRGIHRTPNTFNELTVLFPIHLFAERAAGNVYSHVGDVFDFRCCNGQNVNPKDEITIGSDVWKYFPAAAKTPPSTWNVSGNNIVSSGPYAYAFRKNA
jgi:hypothetical protein